MLKLVSCRSTWRYCRTSRQTGVMCTLVVFTFCPLLIIMNSTTDRHCHPSTYLEDMDLLIYFLVLSTTVNQIPDIPRNLRNLIDPMEQTPQILMTTRLQNLLII